jgi:hypothetical protein
MNRLIINLALMSYKKENNIEFDRDLSPVENKLTIKQKAKKKKKKKKRKKKKKKKMKVRIMEQKAKILIILII